MNLKSSKHQKVDVVGRMAYIENELAFEMTNTGDPPVHIIVVLAVPWMNCV